MWRPALIGAVLVSAAFTALLWRKIPAEPGTQERPQLPDVVPAILVPWAVAIALWAVTFATVAARSWGGAMGVAVGAVVTTIGAVGTRVASHSVRSLYRHAAGHAAEEAFSRAE